MAVILNCCFTCNTVTTTTTNLFPEFMRKPNSPTILTIPMHEDELLNDDEEEELGESAKTKETAMEEKKTFKRTLRELPARQKRRRQSSSSLSSTSSNDSDSSSTNASTSKSTYTDHSDSEKSSNTNSTSHYTDDDDDRRPIKITKKLPPAPITPNSPHLIDNVGSREVTPPPPSPVEVPLDPRVWKAEHIAGWVKWMTKQFKIVPEPDVARFPTTGAELCLLSRAEFWVCAGSCEGGKLFAKHFALTLHSATGRETSPMLNDNEPSKYEYLETFKFFFLL